MSVLPFTRRHTSGEVPVLSRPLAEKLSGSIRGADDAVVQAAAVAANPSRMLIRQACPTCLHRWQAPAQGRCPICGGASVFVEKIPCMAVRL